MSRRRWTEADLKLLRDLYPTTPAKDLAIALDRDIGSVYKRCHLLVLSKSPEFLASVASGRLMPGEQRGLATRFKPGQVPWSKGRTGIRMHPATEFKRGVMPHNHLPVGSVVMATIGWLKIKLAEPKHWELLHLFEWQRAHGPIPKGMAVRHKDGDRQNCAVENLELVSRAEIMRKNSLHTMPLQLQDLSRLKGVLTRTINRKEREAHEQDH